MDLWILVTLSPKSLCHSLMMSAVCLVVIVQLVMMLVGSSMVTILLVQMHVVCQMAMARVVLIPQVDSTHVIMQKVMVL